MDASMESSSFFQGLALLEQGDSSYGNESVGEHTFGGHLSEDPKGGVGLPVLRERSEGEVPGEAVFEGERKRGEEDGGELGESSEAAVGSEEEVAEERIPIEAEGEEFAMDRQSAEEASSGAQQRSVMASDLQAHEPLSLSLSAQTKEKH
jgi:hypothetical protein